MTSASRLATAAAMAICKPQKGRTNLEGNSAAKATAQENLSLFVHGNSVYMSGGRKQAPARQTLLDEMAKHSLYRDTKAA